jgi:hypothetical protein
VKDWPVFNDYTRVISSNTVSGQYSSRRSAGVGRRWATHPNTTFVSRPMAGLTMNPDLAAKRELAVASAERWVNWRRPVKTVLTTGDPYSLLVAVQVLSARPLMVRRPFAELPSIQPARLAVTPPGSLPGKAP